MNSRQIYPDHPRLDPNYEYIPYSRYNNSYFQDKPSIRTSPNERFYEIDYKLSPNLRKDLIKNENNYYRDRYINRNVDPVIFRNYPKIRDNYKDSVFLILVFNRILS